MFKTKKATTTLKKLFPKYSWQPCVVHQTPSAKYIKWIVNEISAEWRRVLSPPPVLSPSHFCRPSSCRPCAASRLTVSRALRICYRRKIWKTFYFNQACNFFSVSFKVNIFLLHLYSGTVRFLTFMYVSFYGINPGQQPCNLTDWHNYNDDYWSKLQVSKWNRSLFRR